MIGASRRSLGMIRYDEVAAGFRVQFHMPLRVDLKDRVKAIAGARWVSARRSWFVPAAGSRELWVALHRHAFEVESTAQEMLRAASGEDASLGGSLWSVLAERGTAPVSPILQEAASYRARQTQLTLEPPDVLPTDEPRSAVNERMHRPLERAVSPRDEAPLTYERRAVSRSLSFAHDTVYPSVQALMQRVDTVLRGAFHAPQWVMGIVQGVTRSRHGHLYFRLTDVDPEIGADQAILNVAIFGVAAARILQTLADSQLTLDEGVTIALCGKVGSYAPRSSLQFVAHDVDVRVSRGEVELQRDRVVEALRAAGLSWKNARLKLPILPERIALVTSAHGDALHDVMRTLTRAKVGASVHLFDVPVQGSALESAVLDALERIGSNASDFDLVLMVRGGGAANELAWWDNVRIGTSVAHLPIPLVVGIGHERDETALHEVARFEATPTAAAQLIAQLWMQAREDMHTLHQRLDRVACGVVDAQTTHLTRCAERFHVRAARQIEHADMHMRDVLTRRLTQGVRRAMDRSRDALARKGAQIERGARRTDARAQMLWQRAHEALATEMPCRKLDIATERLAHIEQRLVRRAQSCVAAASRDLSLAENMIRMSDPSRMLQRGYAIVRDEEGRAVRDASSLTLGASLSVELAHGRIQSVVQSIDSRPASSLTSSSASSENKPS